MFVTVYPQREGRQATIAHNGGHWRVDGKHLVFSRGFFRPATARHDFPPGEVLEISLAKHPRRIAEIAATACGVFAFIARALARLPALSEQKTLLTVVALVLALGFIAALLISRFARKTLLKLSLTGYRALYFDVKEYNLSDLYALEEEFDATTQNV